MGKHKGQHITRPQPRPLHVFVQSVGYSREDGHTKQCWCANKEISADSLCEDRNDSFWPLIIFWLASGFWGVAVVDNVIAATVMGSVASWWFSPGDAGAGRAFHRAVTGSFGWGPRLTCPRARGTFVLTFSQNFQLSAGIPQLWYIRPGAVRAWCERTLLLRLTLERPVYHLLRLFVYKSCWPLDPNPPTTSAAHFARLPRSSRCCGWSCTRRAACAWPAGLPPPYSTVFRTLLASSPSTAWASTKVRHISVNEAWYRFWTTLEKSSYSWKRYLKPSCCLCGCFIFCHDFLLVGWGGLGVGVEGEEIFRGNI